MTVATTSSSVTAQGNGVTTLFNYAFIIPTINDVVVSVVNNTVDPAVVTVLTVSQFTITGLGDPDGGTVEYPLVGSPLATGYSITIERQVPYQQLISIANQGNFYPAVTEQGLDNLEMQIQQVVGQGDRAVHFPAVDSSSLSAELPPAATRANQVCAFDAYGNVTVGQPSSAVVSSAMQPIVGATSIPVADGLWQTGLAASSAPSAPVEYQRWIDTSGTLPVYKVYDGTTWDVVGTLDTANNAWIGGGALNLDADPIIPTVPIGQAGLTIYAAGEVTTTTARSNAHEFGFAVNMVDNLGGTAWNKVGIYSAVEATGVTAGNVWAFNGVALFDANSAPGGNGQVCEWDLAQNTGTIYSANIITGGLVPPAIIGQQITGNGTNPASVALAILGTVTGPTGLWQAGIGFYNNSTNLAAIIDANSSTYSYVMQGSKSVGLDAAGPIGAGTAAAFSTGFIRAGAQQKTLVRKQDDSADMTVWESTGTDELLLGDTPANGMAAVYCQTEFAPVTDNVVSLGDTTHRWTAVWAANGTIQTSDPSMKTDVSPLSELTDAQLDRVITAIEPVMFRWVMGGQEWTEVEEDRDVQATEIIKETLGVIEMRDGKPVQVQRVVEREEELWDWLPVVDLAGNPVMEHRVLPGRVQGEQVQKLHKVPRMERRRVKVRKLVERPGRRVHAGFMAPQVKAAINDALGVDFGGWVQAHDGTQALRPDQLMPFMWEKLRRIIAAKEQ